MHRAGGYWYLTGRKGKAINFGCIGHQGPNCVLRKVGRKKEKNNLGGGEKQLGCRGRGWVGIGRKKGKIRVSRGTWVGWEDERKNSGCRGRVLGGFRVGVV